jgi:Co/Zn/Cd efflux system component
MGTCCGGSCEASVEVPGPYRRVLWIALVVNAAMFVVEFSGGLSSDAASLLADALDFLGDAGNYAISLLVLPLGLVWRARAALAKGVTMGAFGLFVLASTAWHLAHGVVPQPLTMGAIAVVALLANTGIALLLYRYRNGDANMQSVWLCSRNDAIGNCLVIAAAVGVFGTGTSWPDVAVAATLGTLGIASAVKVIRAAGRELDHRKPFPVSAVRVLGRPSRNISGG